MKQPSDENPKVGGRTLEEIFAPGGILDRSLPAYEFRPSQLRMAEAVLGAIRNREHLCAEAGTGTGKTLAYLIPALYSQKRVVVSTATRNLQDQLFTKDIPFIRKNIFPELAVTYMKGRQNYLCLKRFHETQSQLFLPGSGGGLDELAEWARETDTGDRAELDWLSDNEPIWPQLDARSESCIGQKCAYFEDCFVTKMRRKALQSDLVVVNHSLFFANLSLERDEIGKVLPDFAVAILDEAHAVEDIAAGHFGSRVSNYQIAELQRDFTRTYLSTESGNSLRRLGKAAQQMFDALPPGEGRFSLNFHRTPYQEWVDLRDAMQQGYGELRLALGHLYSQLNLIEDRPDEHEALVRRLLALSEQLERIFAEDPDHVYWYERRGANTFVHTTPIDIASVLQETLFSKTDTTVLTSATLTTNSNFEYLRDRLGIEESLELMVPGEFDYASQTLLYVPRDTPEPRSPQYLSSALDNIREILHASQGNAFLLFTSYQMMTRVYAALSADLPYPLLEQGKMPRNRLLETFKTTPGAVLCATASFWQGVDVRGDALRAVVIDKLPFQVPSEPVIAARLHRLQQAGQDPFLRYSVPDAVIRLKQGLGRLIRSRQDRGILAILDSRIRTKGYGRHFLASLPNCPVTDKMDDIRNFFSRGASPQDGGEKK